MRYIKDVGVVKSIYIFRHGETDWNAEGRFQGQLDVPLNERGRDQARDLIPKLKAAGIEAILSSDLIRARGTAEIAAAALGVPVFSDSGLREAHLGDCQGKTIAEIEQFVGRDLLEKWKSHELTDADVSYPGGETGEAVIRRAFLAMRKFISTHSYRKIGVSTHGGVIRRVVAKILHPHARPIPIPNGVLYRLEYHQGPSEHQDEWKFNS